MERLRIKTSFFSAFILNSLPEKGFIHHKTLHRFKRIYVDEFLKNICWQTIEPSLRKIETIVLLRSAQNGRTKSNFTRVYSIQ